MKAIGILLLVNVVAVAAYSIFVSGVPQKSVLAFAGIGLLAGVALIVGDRITYLKVPGIGEITAAAQQAQADAETISAIRTTVEQQRDAIALIVRDANSAREELGRIAALSNEAHQKADTVGELASKATAAVNEIGQVSEFSLTLAAARNDDRVAFSKLLQIANNPGPFKQIAFLGVQEVVQAVNPLLQLRVDPKIEWSEFGIDPATASIVAFRDAYSKARNELRPPFLSTVWGQERVPKYERLVFLVDVLKSESSLRALHRACVLINNEAKLNLNILGVQQYLEWWARNEAAYRSQ